MLTTVALLSVLGLAPGQADGLTLTGVQLTHGVLGPPRRDSRLLPGDSLYVAFTIEGISADPAGKVLYHMTTEVTSASGKVTFKPPTPRDLEAINALGGNSLPAYARIDIGLDEAPGNYTAQIVVTDRTTKKTATLTQPFTVLPKGFGAVRLSITKDAEGLTPAGLLGPGESVWVNMAVVGFARDPNTKQPRVSFELRVLGSDGKPTVTKPFAGVVEKDVGASALSVPVQFLLPLNRAGKFTVEVTATDELTGKKSNLSFPLVVQSPSK
jgi:hypothetical protein